MVWSELSVEAEPSMDVQDELEIHGRQSRQRVRERAYRPRAVKIGSQRTKHLQNRLVYSLYVTCMEPDLLIVKLGFVADHLAVEMLVSS